MLFLGAGCSTTLNDEVQCLRSDGPDWTTIPQCGVTPPTANGCDSSIVERTGATRTDDRDVRDAAGLVELDAK